MLGLSLFSAVSSHYLSITRLSFLHTNHTHILNTAATLTLIICATITTSLIDCPHLCPSSCLRLHLLCSLHPHPTHDRVTHSQRTRSLRPPTFPHSKMVSGAFSNLAHAHRQSVSDYSRLECRCIGSRPSAQLSASVSLPSSLSASCPPTTAAGPSFRLDTAIRNPTRRSRRGLLLLLAACIRYHSESAVADFERCCGCVVCVLVRRRRASG